MSIFIYLFHAVFVKPVELFKEVALYRNKVIVTFITTFNEEDSGARLLPMVK